MSHGSWRGLPRGARADAEIAPGAGAWCAPARTAIMFGLGADERRFGSRAQVNLAMGVPIVAGWPRSGARRCGVRHPSRTCGESSIPSLSNYSADLHFACRAQVARSSSTRSRSTPIRRPPRPSITSTSRCIRSSSARVVASGVGRGCGRVGGREATRMRRAVAAERETTPHRILCIGTVGYA